MCEQWIWVIFPFHLPKEVIQMALGWTGEFPSSSRKLKEAFYLLGTSASDRINVVLSMVLCLGLVPFSSQASVGWPLVRMNNRPYFALVLNDREEGTFIPSFNHKIAVICALAETKDPEP